MASSLNLLSSTSRVEVPFIKVQIGDYTFGFYERAKGASGIDEFGKYKESILKFPNYIKSLDVVKINGQVNKYTLKIDYTIRETDDPNFFDKVFGSVSDSRKIVFSYGDLSVPFYTYKDEEAIITDIKSDVTIASSKITYTVSAISSGELLNYGKHPYIPAEYEKPSVVIKRMLSSNEWGLLEVFYGMKNGTSLNGTELIPGNDLKVQLDAKTNISALEYLKYLVSMMTPEDSSETLKGSVYVLVIDDDVSGQLNGPYFKVIQVNKNVEVSDAYVIDIGYKSKDIVMSFNIDNDESYSIFYNYADKLNDEKFIYRLDARGELNKVYAPIISSGNADYETSESDKTWWSKVTAFPIKASIKLKGLLRPAILMSHVRLNVYFYGRKHISSGLYIVTKEQDTIDETGFRTTLNLLRISADTQAL